MVMLLILVLMAVEWILFVFGVKGQEMIVGAGSVLLSWLFVWMVRRSTRREFDLRARDLAQAWRIPVYLVRDTAEVTWILLLDLLHIKPAGSYFRVSGFKTAKRDPLRVTRRGLVTLFTSATPSTIVLGVDPAQSRMLFHQLKRSDPNAMQHNLGGMP